MPLLGEEEVLFGCGFEEAEVESTEDEIEGAEARADVFGCYAAEADVVLADGLAEVAGKVTRAKAWHAAF